MFYNLTINTRKKDFCMTEHLEMSLLCTLNLKVSNALKVFTISILFEKQSTANTNDFYVLVKFNFVLF